MNPGSRAGPAPQVPPTQSLYLGAVGAIVLGLRGAEFSRGLQGGSRGCRQRGRGRRLIGGWWLSGMEKTLETIWSP